MVQREDGGCRRSNKDESSDREKDEVELLLPDALDVEVQLLSSDPPSSSFSSSLLSLEDEDDELQEASDMTSVLRVSRREEGSSSSDASSSSELKSSSSVRKAGAGWGWRDAPRRPVAESVVQSLLRVPWMYSESDMLLELGRRRRAGRGKRKAFESESSTREVFCHGQAHAQQKTRSRLDRWSQR